MNDSPKIAIWCFTRQRLEPHRHTIPLNRYWQWKDLKNYVVHSYFIKVVDVSEWRSKIVLFLVSVSSWRLFSVNTVLKLSPMRWSSFQWGERLRDPCVMGTRCSSKIPFMYVTNFHKLQLFFFIQDRAIQLIKCQWFTERNNYRSQCRVSGATLITPIRRVTGWMGYRFEVSINRRM